MIISCGDPRPNAQPVNDLDQLQVVETPKAVALKDLISIIDYLPKDASHLLRDLNYHEVEITQYLKDCRLSKYGHKLNTKASSDSSYIYLKFCDKSITVEWEIDKTLDGQIVKVKNEAMALDFTPMGVTNEKGKVVESFFTPLKLFLSTTSNEASSKDRDVVMLMKVVK